MKTMVLKRIFSISASAVLIGFASLTVGAAEDTSYIGVAKTLLASPTATSDVLKAQVMLLNEGAFQYEYEAERAKKRRDDPDSRDPDSALTTADYQELYDFYTQSAKEQRDLAAQLSQKADKISLDASQAAFKAEQDAYTKAHPETAPPQDFRTYNLIVPIPGLSSQTITNPLEYIKGIYNFAVGFGVLVAVAVIIFAGIKWATSAGNVSATGEAKDMILNAVYGLAMLLGAILILSTISPSLTKLSLPNLSNVGKSNFSYGTVADWDKILNQNQRASSEAYNNAMESVEKGKGLLAKGDTSLDGRIAIAKNALETAIFEEQEKLHAKNAQQALENREKSYWGGKVAACQKSFWCTTMAEILEGQESAMRDLARQAEEANTAYRLAKARRERTQEDLDILLAEKAKTPTAPK